MHDVVFFFISSFFFGFRFSILRMVGGGSEGRSLLFIFSLSSSLVEDFAIYDNGEAMKKNLIFCHES